MAKSSLSVPRNSLVGIEHDAVIGDFGNRAARGQRGQARRPLGEHAAAHFVAVNQAGLRRPRRVVKPPASMAITASKSCRGKVAVRPRPPHHREQLVFLPLAARGLGDDLLRQHVERRIERDQPIELAPPHRHQQRGALDQVVAGFGKQPALRRAVNGVAGAADALQQRRDAARRSDLAHQVDVPDVDAELERRGRHDHADRAVLQPRLGIEAALLRQAAVVRRDLRLRPAVPTGGGRSAPTSSACSRTPAWCDGRAISVARRS